MSFELVLLTLAGPEKLQESCTHCYDRLWLDQDYRILGQLIDLSEYRESSKSEIPIKPTIKTHPLPPQLRITYEDHDKRTRQDHWGDELKFAYVEQLKHLRMPSNVSPKNKAIKAFIDALPNDIPIILYWR